MHLQIPLLYVCRAGLVRTCVYIEQAFPPRASWIGADRPSLHLPASLPSLPGLCGCPPAFAPEEIPAVQFTEVREKRQERCNPGPQKRTVRLLARSAVITVYYKSKPQKGQERTDKFPRLFALLFSLAALSDAVFHAEICAVAKHEGAPGRGVDRREGGGKAFCSRIKTPDLPFKTANPGL